MARNDPRRRLTRRLMTGTTAILLFLLLQEPPAATADPLACARIGEGQARLACFDGEFPHAMIQPPAAATGKWQLQTAPSAVARRTDHTITLASQGTVTCRWVDPRPIQLRIRCIANVTSVALETGCYMASGQNRPDGDIALQFDSGEARALRMTAGADGKSLGFWSGDTAIPFARQLQATSTLTVRMTPYADDPVSAVFDLRGIAEAIKPARTACGW